MAYIKSEYKIQSLLFNFGNGLGAGNGLVFATGMALPKNSLVTNISCIPLPDLHTTNADEPTANAAVMFFYPAISFYTTPSFNYNTKFEEINSQSVNILLTADNNSYPISIQPFSSDSNNLIVAGKVLINFQYIQFGYDIFKPVVNPP